MKRLLACAAALAALTGCFAEDDRLAWQVLDTSLERPRVIGIRLRPPLVRRGLRVRVEALAIGPQEPDSVSLDWCPPLLDRLSHVHRDCFGAEELVAPIADALPAVFVAPDLSGIACEPDAYCASDYPIRVTANFDGYEAMASLQLTQFVTPGEGRPPPNIDDFEHAVEGPERARGGETITLRARIAAPVTEMRWWTDAGELLGTGRTIPHGLDGASLYSENRLVIPRGWRGPLRVAVVYVGAPSADLAEPTVGDQAWDVFTFEVGG